MADNVLEALTAMVTLYGEQMVLCQYLPYAWDLLMICRYTTFNQPFFLETLFRPLNQDYFCPILLSHTVT